MLFFSPGFTHSTTCSVYSAPRLLLSQLRRQ